VTNRNDTFEADPFKPLTNQQKRLLENGLAIREAPPDRNDFLHSVMCQVGLPRRATDAKTFERQNGPFSILLEAGKLYNGKGWVEHPLPYGTTPRLVMVHLSSEAIRTQNRRVELGDSMRQFLQTLGLQTNGGERGGYTVFRKQMEALAACRLTIGMRAEGRVVTVDAKPIKRFEAWFQPDGEQQALWPGSLELSPDFYETLRHHAVPLDYRALSALKHSALALDIYTWLAHRLCRVKEANGVRLTWENLKDQFGQEYSNIKDFKREFRNVLRQVWQVYPSARLEEEFGGIRLFESQPPIPKTTVSFAGLTREPPMDKSGEW
jgi:Plasmid encoded RepA protein